MERIVTVSESAELVIPGEILEQIGVSSGDSVKLDIEGRKLVVRSLNEADLEHRMDEAMDALMERRSKLFEKLAEGAK